MGSRRLASAAGRLSLLGSMMGTKTEHENLGESHLVAPTGVRGSAEAAATVGTSPASCYGPQMKLAPLATGVVRGIQRDGAAT
jgi:hypothetical protein